MTKDYCSLLNERSNKYPIKEFILGEAEIIVNALEDQESYDTGSTSTSGAGGSMAAEALNPNKLKQRAVLMKHIRKDGTSLELFGGRGNLTKAIYVNYFKKNILVEEDLDECDFGQKSLGDQAKYYHMNNMDFIREELPKIKDDLTFVDFDAFGITSDAIIGFFDNYKITKPVVIGITDGYASHIHRYYMDKAKLYDDVITHHYPVIERERMSANIFWQHVLRRLIEEQCKKHNLEYRHINQSMGHGSNAGQFRMAGKNTVYTGHIIGKKLTNE